MSLRLARWACSGLPSETGGGEHDEGRDAGCEHGQDRDGQGAGDGGLARAWDLAACFHEHGRRGERGRVREQQTGGKDPPAKKTVTSGRCRRRLRRLAARRAGHGGSRTSRLRRRFRPTLRLRSIPAAVATDGRGSVLVPSTGCLATVIGQARRSGCSACRRRQSLTSPHQGDASSRHRWRGAGCDPARARPAGVSPPTSRSGG